MKIVLTGGGTLGPVAPLVAVWQALKEKNFNIEVLFIGTATGPERVFLAQYPEIKFVSVPAGKIRRYFSLLNIFTPFLTAAGFIKAWFILRRFKPQAVVSAGGFVAVPVIWAARLLKIKIFIHQLDFQPTLSNVIVKNLAEKITVTFAKSLNDFKEKQPLLVGSLIKQEAKTAESAQNTKNESQPKIVLFLGGGTGAQALNELALQAAPLLPQLQIWQITGQGKKISASNPPANLTAFEFLTEDYYQKFAQADLVITRAGLSTLMELSYFQKPAILIPLPNSHQQENAQYFNDRGAAIMLNQHELTPEILADKIKVIINQPAELENLSEKISKTMDKGGESKLAEIILKAVE